MHQSTIPAGWLVGWSVGWLDNLGLRLISAPIRVWLELGLIDMGDVSTLTFDLPLLGLKGRIVVKTQYNSTQLKATIKQLTRNPPTPPYTQTFQSLLDQLES